MSNFACRSSTPTVPFSVHFTAHWRDFASQVKDKRQTALLVDGHSLSIASLVASARYQRPCAIPEAVLQSLEHSAAFVTSSLTAGDVIYGVNTGFGGSADARTAAIAQLQATLMDELHYGVLLPSDTLKSENETDACGTAQCLSFDTIEATTHMPEAWTRASMLVRLNSLVQGPSGVRASTAQSLASLLTKNVTPLVPLRGSISASGDLSPLSYIAGALQGKRCIRVWADQPGKRARRVCTAAEALEQVKISPITLEAKEGLALVNGTAVSAGVAALALHETYAQAALVQILTAMTVEAILGTDDSFDPFIAQVRPHPGQIDSAKCIYHFLSTSRLVKRNDGKEDMLLRQDRYSVRTASQWIGPVLEDILLAHQQVSTELNSVTDNPLVNISQGTVINGGNFQAKSVTSAMEKVRLGIQSIGRMIFAQCTEIINPATSRGLPANLTADEPSESLLWKGTDIYIASLASELGFLANPVGSHVMTAEMGNQSLNSLALISTRYTMTALDVLGQMSSLHLMALCQALDLRALQHMFQHRLRQSFTTSCQDHFGSMHYWPTIQDGLEAAWGRVMRSLEQNMNMDSEPRMRKATGGLWESLMNLIPDSTQHVRIISDFMKEFSTQAVADFQTATAEYRAAPDASPLISNEAGRLYRFVRQELGVPFMGRSGRDVCTSKPNINGFEQSEALDVEPSVGTYVSRIYEAMRSGRLYSEVAFCFEGLQMRAK